MPEDIKPLQLNKEGLPIDEVYLRIFEQQQGWTSTRWNIAIFFFSVSFALFGLSFQNNISTITGTEQRLAGLAIYWFTYLLFRRFDDWSKFLRAKLEELELTTSTYLKLQTSWKETMQTGLRQATSTGKLLFYFGVLYTIAVIILG